MFLEPAHHLHELAMAEDNDLSRVAPRCISQQAPGPINKLPEGFCARTVAVVRVTEIPVRQYPRTPGGSRRTHALWWRQIGELLHGRRAYRHAKPAGKWLRRLPGTHKWGAHDRRRPAGPILCKVLCLPNPQVCQDNAIQAVSGQARIGRTFRMSYKNHHFRRLAAPLGADQPPDASLQGAREVESSLLDYSLARQRPSCSSKIVNSSRSRRTSGASKSTPAGTLITKPAGVSSTAITERPW